MAKQNDSSQGSLVKVTFSNHSLHFVIYLFIFFRINFAFACKCLLSKPLCIWFGQSALLIAMRQKRMRGKARRFTKKSVSADVSNLLHTIRLYVTNPSQAKLHLGETVSGDWRLYFCYHFVQNNSQTHTHNTTQQTLDK